jgi:hypothetical protein
MKIIGDDATQLQVESKEADEARQDHTAMNQFGIMSKP